MDLSVLFFKEFFYFFSSKEQGIKVCLAGDLFYFGIYFLVGGDIDIGVFIFLYDSEVFDEFDDVEMFIKVWLLERNSCRMSRNS